MKYFIKCWIPCDIPVLYDKYLDVLPDLEQHQLMHPENIYEIRMIDDDGDEVQTG
jgi:hypothetical protein